MEFVGSNPIPVAPILRCTGGGGNEAARAKNSCSILVIALELNESRVFASCPGRTPKSGSTQVPHPSVQSFLSVATCPGPRCSTHPGQAQRRPQVHPDPAIDEIVLIGGITGNSGIGLLRAGMYGKSSVMRRGGRFGPGEGGYGWWL